jgi:hypothetical protein
LLHVSIDSCWHALSCTVNGCFVTCLIVYALTWCDEDCSFRKWMIDECMNEWLTTHNGQNCQLLIFVTSKLTAAMTVVVECCDGFQIPKKPSKEHVNIHNNINHRLVKTRCRSRQHTQHCPWHTHSTSTTRSATLSTIITTIIITQHIELSRHTQRKLSVSTKWIASNTVGSDESHNSYRRTSK